MRSLKGMNRQPRREWGPEDETAEKEGNAQRRAAALRPTQAPGKGSQKDRNREGRAERIHQNKVESRYVGAE